MTAVLHDRPTWVWALAAIVAVIAVARVTRLVVHDSWPPMAWVRNRWVTWAEVRDNGWDLLLTCPFCFAPWAAAVSLGWGYWSGVDPDRFWGIAWWLGHGWFTLAYLAAILVVRDEPADD